MENKKNELIMLGTGNAAVTRCYNTCFALRTSQGTLLVDAGGGNGILIQLEKQGLPFLTFTTCLLLTHIPTIYLESSG